MGRKSDLGPYAPLGPGVSRLPTDSGEFFERLERSKKAGSALSLSAEHRERLKEAILFAAAQFQTDANAAKAKDIKKLLRQIGRNAEVLADDLRKLHPAGAKGIGAAAALTINAGGVWDFAQWIQSLESLGARAAESAKFEPVREAEALDRLIVALLEIFRGANGSLPRTVARTNATSRNPQGGKPTGPILAFVRTTLKAIPGAPVFTDEKIAARINKLRAQMET